MQEIAAYLLLKIAGKDGSAEEITSVVEAAGGSADESAITTLLGDMDGKDINELLASGMEKLKDVPMGGGGGGGQTRRTMAELEARGITVRDVAPADFIAAYALHLKNSDKFELPKWTDVVKTGTNKELSPYDPDWYYTRAAAVARKVYLQPGMGVGALQRKFGGSKNRGTRTFTFGKAAGGIIRNILQQLEEIKVIEISEKGGRIISRVGQQDLDRIAGQVAGGAGDDASGSDSDED